MIKTLGHCKITGLISKGGMGEVYRTRTFCRVRSQGMLRANDFDVGTPPSRRPSAAGETPNAA
jgi:hypothetical protein